MSIDEIIRTPMADLRFRDFMSLKSGRDEFSRLKLPALAESVSYCDVADTQAALESDADRAKVYRWILRGLPCEKAIRKVKTDNDMGKPYTGPTRAHNQALAHYDIETVDGITYYPEYLYPSSLVYSSDTVYMEKLRAEKRAEESRRHGFS